MNTNTDSNTNTTEEPIGQSSLCGTLTEVDTNNFKKTDFSYNDIKYEIAISLYQNLIFVIISSNSKIGSLWSMELEEEHEEDELNANDEDNIPKMKEAKCLLGDRKDEKTAFAANAILNFISNGLSKYESSDNPNKNIKQLLLSLSVVFPATTEELPTEFREFLQITQAKLTEILAI